MSMLFCPAALPQKEIEDLEDAGNELMLLDDDSVPMAVGDCFVHLSKDAVEERLAQSEPCRQRSGGSAPLLPRVAPATAGRPAAPPVATPAAQSKRRQSSRCVTWGRRWLRSGRPCWSSSRRYMQSLATR